MLFDFNTSVVIQNQQKDAILYELNEIALQPITASPDKRDILQEQLIRFIYKQPFDSLYGGLVVRSQNNNEYFKPKETNQILREIFTQADQVFYHGLFSYIANQINGYLINTVEERYFKQDLPACFTESELNGCLDDKEKQLLNALVFKNKLQLNKEILFISYSRSLEDSALAIDMHVKEAQIVEFSIQNKLMNHS